MQTRKGFGDRVTRTTFAVITAAILVSAATRRVSAYEILVLSAGQGFEVALPGTGSHFAPVPQGTSLAEGSEVRTGKTGWATLRLENDTQVELHADSVAAFRSVSRPDETLKTGATTGEGNRSDAKPISPVSDSPFGMTTRNAPADTPPDTGPVVEIELRRGALAVLADGATELRIRFANSVTMAKHARFAVKASQGDRARVIVERGTARIFVRGGKTEVSPMAGQYVEINQQATGRVVTAVQAVRSNDTEAVAEMAALRFVPALAEPAAKPPLTAVDNSTANPPTAAVPATSTMAATNAPPVTQGASTAVPASLPPALPLASTVQPGAVATTSYGATPLGNPGNVDPLQAPANGANIRSPVTSPEHP